MDNLGDFNETNIKQSEVALVNNFIFLDYSQHGIYLKKAKNRWYQWSIDESSAPDEHWNGFIRHYVFLKDYKKYCDKNYDLPLFDTYDIRRRIKKIKHKLYLKEKYRDHTIYKILGLKFQFGKEEGKNG